MAGFSFFDLLFVFLSKVKVSVADIFFWITFPNTRRITAGLTALRVKCSVEILAEAHTHTQKHI